MVEAFDGADQKAMLMQNVGSYPLVTASGLAGHGSGESIKVHKIGDSIYVVGDLQTGAKPGCGLMAPRVGIAAHMQANLVVQILLEIMNKLIKQMTFHSIRLRIFPVLNDNFVYLLDDGNHVINRCRRQKQVIDVVNNERLKLLQVLITHDHKDHTMGCRILQEKFGVLSRSPSKQSN